MCKFVARPLFCQVNIFPEKFFKSNLGVTICTKFDEFSENFRRVGGVISDPKNFVAVFLVILGG